MQIKIQMNTMDNLYAIGGLMDKVPGMGGGDAPDMGGQKTELVKLFMNPPNII